MNSPEKENQPIKAAFWMLGAVVSFSAMAIAGREMAGLHDTFEIMMYRSMLGVVLVVIIAKTVGTLSEITTRDFGKHFGRNLAHFTGQNLWFYAVTVIPFAQLFAFEFSVPIWVVLAAPIFLGEGLTKLKLGAVMAGFIGILMVTRPWEEPLSLGIAAAALCAIAFAATTILTKQLTRRHSITCILFWLTTLQLAFGAICVFLDGQITLPNSQSIGWLLIVGFGGLMAHFSITKALTLADASVVSPVDFIRLPIIAAIGYAFYNEALDIWVIFGAVIIFSANYINIYAENRKKRVALS